jgi:hypothetical protein
MEGNFCLAPPLPDDLVNSLFRDTENLGDAGPSFTCLVARDDFGVTFHLCGHRVVLRFGWEWRIIQHFNDVKRRQPNVEASYGFEPPMGHGFGALWGTACFTA